MTGPFEVSKLILGLEPGFLMSLYWTQTDGGVGTNGGAKTGKEADTSRAREGPPTRLTLHGCNTRSSLEPVSEMEGAVE